MTLKEELEILRGEPIKVFTGDPMSIPCIETSDPEKLCKHPVVSVSMITYNHEPYIRQAIEGVMMQKTDFEFELIIGEDCSQDKTREICFEYQKKYPDKIRVLWWHENVSKLGGNGRRCAARRRGEFVALCEGDDYWIDPLKLQKQVDVMRKHPNVGLCFSAANFVNYKGEFLGVRDYDNVYPRGVISGQMFNVLHMFGSNPVHLIGNEGFIMTASVLFRRRALEEASKKFEISSWKLACGDKILFHRVAAVSDVYFLPEVMTAYRKNPTGAMATNNARVRRDVAVTRMYFAHTLFDMRLHDLPRWQISLLFQFVLRVLSGECFLSRFKKVLCMFNVSSFLGVVFRNAYYPLWLVICVIWMPLGLKYKCFGWLFAHTIATCPVSGRLGRLYV